MHKRVQIIAPILIVAFLASVGYWWWNQRATAANADSQLTGSGTIETEDVLITSEIAGRIKSLPVDEGQDVTVGETLAQLDSELLEAQRDQAKAAVEVAEARLAELKAGAREEDVMAAQAKVDQAKAARDGADQGYQNALAILKDPQELDTQIVQARAARDAAKRTLDQVSAGSRTEDIGAAAATLDQAQANLQHTRDQLSMAKTQAEAQVKQSADALTQAQAAYSRAKSNLQYARDTGNDPIQPELCSSAGCKDNELSDAQRANYEMQLVQAEAAMHQAEVTVQQVTAAAQTARQAEVSGVEAAEAQLQTAQENHTKLVNGPRKEDLAVAQTALSNAQKVLDMALTIRKNPLQLKATTDAAKAQLESAEAQLAQAQAGLELTKNGARSEQIQAAVAQLDQAKAALRQIEVQIGKATLKSPRAGLVLSRSMHEGEQANAGTTIMTVGALDTVRLTIYVSETDIGHVRQGQTANVTVDSFPNRVFTGTITFIAQEAQFTPRNVQTKDERATTVFAVRIEIPNTDHALKPGMPADAVIPQ